MDAVKFLEEANKMCESYFCCADCPANANCRADTMPAFDAADAAYAVAIVEKWSAAHQHKTRQSVFLEQYPNAKVFVDGVLDFCPQELDSHYPCQSTDIEMRCQSCRREFWMQKVE